jgi:Na+-transporting methylmalonyl-CoA/oxaloacetate decarboxylase gamma subunit
MYFLTSLIIFVGFAFVVYVGLIKIIRELSQLSFHESPEDREAPSELAAAEYAKEVESYESNPTERIDTQ